MKILYLYQYFGTSKGSWSTRVHEFGRRWVAAGDRVTVVTSVYDKSDLQPSQWLSRHLIDGIDVRVINVRLSNKHGLLVRLLTFVAFAVVSCWYAIRLPADIVIASSGPISVGIPGLLARYVRRRSLVFEVRDLWPEGAVQLGIVRNRFLIWLARRLEVACYRAASRIVVLSEGMADWIRRTYGFTHTEVVPNASDCEFFARHQRNGALPAWAADKRLVLYTGSLGVMDDCWQIVRMAECLQRRGDDRLRIVVIGEGKQRVELERFVQQRGVSNVSFLGLLPKQEVAQWLGAARCALLSFRAVPVLDTVSPNKMFDAFAAGVPVVQSTQGWIKELLARENCGVTVDADDPEKLADAVQLLVNDEPLHQTLSTNSRRVAEQLFDRSLLAGRYRELLANVLRARG